MAKLSKPLPEGGTAEQGPSLYESLRSIVADQLAAGYPPLPTTARKAGIPVRTLQRRLAHEGLTYSDLVVEVTLDRARELLRDRLWKIHEIASALGYSDPANFSRAFKSYVGMTPSQYRKANCGSHPPKDRVADRRPDSRRAHRP